MRQGTGAGAVALDLTVPQLPWLPECDVPSPKDRHHHCPLSPGAEPEVQPAVAGFGRRQANPGAHTLNAIVVVLGQLLGSTTPPAHSLTLPHLPRHTPESTVCSSAGLAPHLTGHPCPWGGGN